MADQRTAADAKAIEAYRRSRARGASHQVAFNIACGIWYAHCPGPAADRVRQRLSLIIERVEPASITAKKDATVACAARVIAISALPERWHSLAPHAVGQRSIERDDDRTIAMLVTVDRLLGEHAQLMTHQTALYTRAKSLMQRTKRNLFYAAMYLSQPQLPLHMGPVDPLHP